MPRKRNSVAPAPGMVRRSSLGDVRGRKGGGEEVPETALDMSHKICLITGGHQGVGKSAAKLLANLNATVILVAPTRELGNQAQLQLMNETTNMNVDFIVADLTDQADTLKMTEAFRSRFGRLHVLINAASIFRRKRNVTADMIEVTFAINYLSQFLVTNLLLDLLVKTDLSRVINVTRKNHMLAKLNLQDIMYSRKYSVSAVQGQSRLCAVMFTYSLARRLRGTGVTVVCCDAGEVDKTDDTVPVLTTDPSQMREQKDHPKIFRCFMNLMTQVLAPPADRGAKVAVFLATDPSISEQSGSYYTSRSKKGKTNATSYSQDLQREIWRLSLEWSSLTALKMRNMLEEFSTPDSGLKGPVETLKLGSMPRPSSSLGLD